MSLTLYRKRLIPEECILLKDDLVLHRDSECIVTSWRTLKPRKDIHHGYSCYYLNKGIKVSKFCKEDGSLLYWYCDIVTYDYSQDSDTYVVTDLLADVIIYPDGFVKVVDVDELAIALDQNLLSTDLLKCALLQLNSLLSTIYEGEFDRLKEPILQRE